MRLFKNKNYLSSALILFSVALIHSLAGANFKHILKKEYRDDVLGKAEALLNLSDENFELRLSKVKSPFEKETPDSGATTPGMVTSSGSDDPVPVPVKPVPTRLSDSQALRVIANTIRPTGVMRAGNRRLLLLSNNRNMRMGQVFVAKIRGEEYRVTISEITDNTFTLKVGQETIERSVRVKRIKGISFD